MQDLRGEGGGGWGQIRCIVGNVEVAYSYPPVEKYKKQKN